MQKVLCGDGHTVCPRSDGSYPPFCNYPLCECPVLASTGGRRVTRGGSSTAGLEQPRRASRTGPSCIL